MKPIILLFLFSLSLLTAEDKEVLNTVVPDEKIRMINGEFSELKNYVGDGPLLLEFWNLAIFKDIRILPRSIAFIA